MTVAVATPSVSLRLLTAPGGNPKLAKNTELGYLTAALHLSPATESGVNLCPAHSAGCAQACLYHSGRASFSPKINEARMERSRIWNTDPEMFLSILWGDIAWLEHTARRTGFKAAVRLNATSDVAWERERAFRGKTLMELCPDVQFYDYTKRLDREPAENYHLTFSRSESNDRVVQRQLAKGQSCAVVFERDLPDEWMGYEVIDGDVHDARFLDPPGVVVGLRVKGARGKADQSGFVVRAAA